MQASEQNSIILEPLQTAVRSIIWLHGLGASGDDFVPIVPQLNIQDQYNIRFIFPHAPNLPVTINNGYVMPAWFDIMSLDKSGNEDQAGITLAKETVNNLIQAEHNKGIPYANILLVGFSQGGALALYAGLKFPKKLAGIIGLSCYLPRFDQEYAQINNNTPIMMAHGEQDPVVLSTFAKAARDKLSSLNYKVSWHSYNMEHQVCAQEITDITNFIEATFR